MNRQRWLLAALLTLAAAAAAAQSPDRQQARAAVERRDFATALPAYTQLLALSPDDADLLIEAARVNGFADRNHAAAALYRRALLAAPGRRADIVPSLAWQTLWSGDARAALPLFDEAAAMGDTALRRRLDDGWLLRETRPSGSASIEHAVDSDSLETLAVSVGAGLHLPGAATLDLRLRHLTQTDANGAPRGEELQATYSWRWDDPAGRFGSVRPAVALRVARFGDWSPLLGVLRAAWLPNNSWRVDAEWARDRVETPQATAQRVTVDVLSLGADRRFGPLLGATAAMAALRFDDGNRRLRVHGHVDQVLLAQPRWSVGAAALAFESSAPTGPGVPGRGYWNPKRYSEARVYSELRWEMQPWDFSGRVGLGSSRETDGFGNRSSGRPHQWELAIGHDLDRDLRASLVLAGSGSALGLGGVSGGGTGYSRRTVGFSIVGWF